MKKPIWRKLNEKFKKRKIKKKLRRNCPMKKFTKKIKDEIESTNSK